MSTSSVVSCQLRARSVSAWTLSTMRLMLSFDGRWPTRSERTLVEIHSADEPDAVLKSYCDRVVYVGGGPPVWKAYAHLIRHWDVTRLPYDGEADRYFDPGWLFAR